MDDHSVALISHEFPPFVEGGVASNCLALACSLSKKRVPTTVFCGGSRSKEVTKLNDYLDVIRLPLLDIPPRFVWFQVQNFKVLSKLLQEYSVVHGVSPTASTVFGYLRKKLRVPFVTSIHEVVLDDLKVFMSSPLREWTLGDFGLHVLEYPLFEFLIRRSMKVADHIVVCGSSALAGMRKLNYRLDFEKVSVIPNGVNFDEIRMSEKSSHGNSSIVFYGRLVWRKGVLHLIKAMEILKRDFPDLTAEIIGKGPLEPKIKSSISHLGLDKSVYLRGFLPKEDLASSINEALVVCLPSLYEVGPFIAALEAMAYGKPLVAFDCPFTREFIMNMENGVLAKAGDVDDLARKIRLLLVQENLRRKIGQNALAYVRRNHDWDKLVDEYLSVYERVRSGNFARTICG